MRKLALLVLASLMLVGGLYVLLFGHKFVVAGAVIAFAGGYLIWAASRAVRMPSNSSLNPLWRSETNRFSSEAFGFS